MRFQINPFTDKLDISGMGPGATSVDFLTGNSGGAVAADAGYNINVLGDNTSGINTIGNLAPNTLTIFGLASSTTQIGTTRYATNAEAAAQTIGTAALTPANVTSLFSTNYLPSSQGGTGLSSPAAHSLIVTNGSSPYTVLGIATNGQLPIGSVGGDPVLNTITAGTGVTVTNGPGTITIAATTGTLTWQAISANQTLVVEHGYICISPGGALSLALPAVSALGDVLEVTLDGSTSWTITQSAGQQIRIGNTATTAGVGGSLTSTQQGDSIRMVCSVANLKWNVVSSMGNPTVV